MSKKPHRYAVALGCLLLVGCGAEDDLQPLGLSGKADIARQPAGIPRVVVLAIDQATVDWASVTPSSLDGQPIGPPAPDKRFREIFARLTERLSELARPPAVLALDYDFSRHDGASTQSMAAAFDRAPFPVALIGGATDLDPRVHSAQRLQGHPNLFRDLVAQGGEPTPGRWGIPLDGALPPLAAAIRAAQLQTSCGEDPATAQRRADANARDMAQTFTTAMQRKYVAFGDWQRSKTAAAIPLAPVDLAELSAVELLDQAPRPAVAELLAGAVVIVGGYWAQYNDQHDLLENGQPVPGVLAHGWTAKHLVARGCGS